MSDISQDISIPYERARTAIVRFKGDVEYLQGVENQVIGAGLLVRGGYLLTCAHVVRDVLGLQKEECPIDREVTFDFIYPQKKLSLRAKVLLFQYKKNDDDPYEDIAGLRILDAIPEDVQPVSFLADYQSSDPYKVEGFPSGHPHGLISRGELVGDNSSGWVQLEDNKTQGLQIISGFSGAPVWCQMTSGCLGMAVAFDKNRPESKIGFMVPARQLSPLPRFLERLDLLDILKDYA